MKNTRTGGKKSVPSILIGFAWFMKLGSEEAASLIDSSLLRSFTSAPTYLGQSVQ
jgi:hypothetical protein